MQLYVPATVRHEQVEAAVPPGTIWVDVSSDDEAYWRALCDIWAKGEDFALIEHDVVIHDDVVRQFEQCPEPWCVFPYQPICHEACQEAWANMLGCTRFRAEVMEKLPDAVTSIPDEVMYKQNRRDYHNLCDELGGNKIAGVDQPTLRPRSLRWAGFKHHWHRPPVLHRSWL